jgi:hypothetical protein
MINKQFVISRAADLLKSKENGTAHLGAESLTMPSVPGTIPQVYETAR